MLKKLNKATVENYYTKNTTLTDAKVEETKISAKDAYLINTASGEIPVQVYYINGGTSLTVGATIVYQSSASKEKYEAEVTELIGTISYSDDSLKAISTIEMYSNIFGTYNGVFDHVVTEDTTVEEQTNTNEQETEQDETTTQPDEKPVEDTNTNEKPQDETTTDTPANEEKPSTPDAA